MIYMKVQCTLPVKGNDLCKIDIIKIKVLKKWIDKNFLAASVYRHTIAISALLQLSDDSRYFSLLIFNFYWSLKRMPIRPDCLKIKRMDNEIEWGFFYLPTFYKVGAVVCMYFLRYFPLFFIILHHLKKMLKITYNILFNCDFSTEYNT